jgi:hypothetical protein
MATANPFDVARQLTWSDVADYSAFSVTLARRLFEMDRESGDWRKYLLWTMDQRERVCAIRDVLGSETEASKNKPVAHRILHDEKREASDATALAGVIWWRFNDVMDLLIEHRDRRPTVVL